MAFWMPRALVRWVNSCQPSAGHAWWMTVTRMATLGAAMKMKATPHTAQKARSVKVRRPCTALHPPSHREPGVGEAAGQEPPAEVGDQRDDE